MNAAIQMKRLTRLAATLTVIAAAGYGLVFGSRYSDGRNVSKWTAAVAPPLAEKEARPGPVRAVTHSERRKRAQPGSCASQTWPNITPECITDTAEPVKVTERWVPNVEAPSSIVLRPTKTPGIVLDIESTGSLPAIGSTRTVTESTPTTGPRRTEAEIGKPKKLKAYARVEGQSQARVVLATLSDQTGLSREELLSRLSRNLPEAVDRYTPDGRLPAATEFSRS